MRKMSPGFSLIELLITMAIIGLIAVVAYPAYDNHIIKSRRTEAKTTLMEMAQKQEDYRSDTNRYTGNAVDLHIQFQSKEYYDFAISNAGPSTYTLTATPKVGSPQQVNDKACAVFTLTQTGARTAQDADGNPSVHCWE